MEHFPLADRLHTDVLAEKYGPISARVLNHDFAVREAHLVDAQGISRTFAITFFPEKKENIQIATIDQKISEGTPIGMAFREQDYSIRKNVIDVYTLELPDWLRAEFQTAESFAKARLSEFYAKRHGFAPVIYGTVVEIYTPDFRSPVINNVDVAQVNAATEVLEKAGFSKEQIWQRIGMGNDWSDAQTRVEKAKEASLHLVFSLKKRINCILDCH